MGMKTKDAKEKKFRQLSDEDLEKVNGGINAGSYMPLFFVQSGDLAAGIGDGACPDSEKDKFGKYIPKFTVTN